MTDWAKILKAGCPQGNASIIAGFALSLPDIVEKYAINTPLRQAHFLAQTAWESDYFLTTTEYASGHAYEGRHDLGNIRPGDGVKYKGRGLIQITGMSNYAKVGKELGRDFTANPGLLATFPFAAESAALFWRDHGINQFADRDDCGRVTRMINGGLNGFAGRQRLTAQFKHALGVK
jgi:putative chitinase